MKIPGQISVAINTLASQIDIVAARVGTNEASILDETTARVTADEALSQSITTLVGRVGVAEAFATSESSARVNADLALSDSIAILSARLGTAEASVVTEASARVSADSAISSSLATLQSQYDTSTATFGSQITTLTGSSSALSGRVDGLQSSIAGVDTALRSLIATEQSARTTADSAMANQLTLVEAKLNGSTGSGLSTQIATANQARIDGDSALATQVSSVSSKVNGFQASINSTSASVNGLLLRHSILLNSNGHVTGFIQNNDGVTGSFTAVADMFKIVAPNGGNPVTPFMVTAEGVRIDGNLTVTGSINSDKLADNATTATAAGVGTGGTMSSAGTVDCAAATLNCTGGLVRVDFAAFARKSAQNTAFTGYARVVRRKAGQADTFVGRQMTVVGADLIPMSAWGFDRPGAGDVTYILQFTRDAGTGGSLIYSGDLCVTEYKDQRV